MSYFTSGVIHKIKELPWDNKIGNVCVIILVKSGGVRGLYSATLWQKSRNLRPSASKTIILRLRDHQDSQDAIYINPKLWRSKVTNQKTLILEKDK